ncbi:MAG: hypothetical protein AAF919_19225 [Pseudomonadota bacterium]
MATQGGWEPSSETAKGLFNAGVLFLMMSYIAQAMFWINFKLGLYRTSFRLGVKFGFLAPDTSAEDYISEYDDKFVRPFLRGMRFFSLGLMFLGIFALAVGFAKGTL